ncbi:unnamed protein product [Ambrosiozyma monospora]|uniref:Unnamed protein product n=1 Tax=Ambrosiozyma monospora TaxID=43982 RepID=A0A9W6Z4D4_AMBMO|nr:unnamed protein product [Ambrosiozyma monospora]
MESRRSRGNYSGNRGRRGGRGNSNRHGSTRQHHETSVWTSSSTLSASSITDNADILHNKEILEKRRQKFENDSKNIERQKSSEYGLISRGEDMRLRDNADDRHKLFETTLSQMKAQRAQTPKIPTSKSTITTTTTTTTTTAEDKILMSFRKLRESLLSVQPDNFTKTVFLTSARFSVSLGHHQSYIPCINQLIQFDKEHEHHFKLLSRDESEEMLCYLALHMAHFKKDQEGAFAVLLYNFPDVCDSVVAHGGFGVDEKSLQGMDCCSVVFLCVYCLTIGDYCGWLRILKFLESDSVSSDTVTGYESVYSNFARLMRFRYDEVVRSLIKGIGSSYFVLGKSVLEEFTGVCWDKLVSQFDVGWSLNDSTNTVTIRQRRKK